MATNVGFLQRVFAHEGPFASVCLDSGRVAEDALQAVRLRWRNLRDSLAADGADERTLTVMDEVVGTKSHHAGQEGQVVVAAAGELLIDERLHQAPDRDRATWAPLPDVLPVLRGSPPLVPHLVVRVDRTGADIQAYGRFGDDAEQVDGVETPIKKVRAGGWSQRRYQQRAENTWERNAKEVAERLDKLVARYAPRFVAVGGDVRARAALLEHVSGRVRPLIVEVEHGSRSPGAGEVDRRAAELVDEHVRADDRSILEALTRELGRGENAVQGLDDTVDALRRAQVDTLVLEDEPDTPSRLWIGPDPLDLGAHPDRVVGELGAVQACADCALVRAAAAGDARVLLVAPDAVGLPSGVGAVLRYTDHLP